MSVTVELRAVERGSDDYLEAAWRLKEHIRREEGVLKQRRSFFSRAYTRAKVHLLLGGDGDLLGFAATRSDGYLLFLAVHPEARNRGLGRRLVATVAEEHGTVTCHARSSNEAALRFYRRLDFEVVRRIAGYYEDGGDAYLLRLGEPSSFGDRIRSYLRS